MSAVSFVPRLVFLTRGIGIADDRLCAFDAALCQAGVSSQNLVAVSSVFPPQCSLLSRDEGLAMLRPGQIRFCVLSRHESNEPGREIAASVGVILPPDQQTYGYLSEWHAEEDEATAAKHSRRLAQRLLAAKLGVSPEAIAGRDATSIAQSATVAADGRWTVVVALAVFML
jgi:arginine decarboxylase